MMRFRKLATAVVAFATTTAILGLAEPASAAFPGTNGRIAFGSDRYGDTHNIFTMTSTGTDVRQLTFLTADQGATLRQSWSPDGTKLVYEQRDNSQNFRQIFIMNADGSDQHQLIQDPGFLDFDPGFSPDGQTVIFSRCHFLNRVDTCAIATVRASDGRGLIQLTQPNRGRQDFQPRYSPNGTKIAFTSFGRKVDGASYVMNANGTGVHRITANGSVDVDWAPNGSHITFWSSCCTDDPSHTWTANADGSSPSQLTSPPSGFSDFSPVYSPVGDQITFERDADDGTPAVYVVPSGGGTPVLVEGNAFLPVWGAAV